MHSRADDNGQKATLLEDNLQARSPVFIISPAHRSGTNFLGLILLQHPNFQLPNLIWEDYVLVHSQLLAKYASQTSKSMGWAKEIRGNEDYAKNLLNHLGGGILSFLYEHIGEGKRLLCRTPISCNVDNFFRLFPNAKLLILIRDGRDVVQSAVSSGRHKYLAFEWYAYTWAKGARSILKFMRGPGRDLQEKSWKLIKYEELVERPDVTVGDLLYFLDIDINTFDIKRVQNLPLLGSSFHRGGEKEVHWNPVEKPKDFRPVGRWKSWNYLRKMKFKMIAGRELIHIGYVDSNHW